MQRYMTEYIYELLKFVRQTIDKSTTLQTPQTKTYCIVEIDLYIVYKLHIKTLGYKTL